MGIAYGGMSPRRGYERHGKRSPKYPPGQQSFHDYSYQPKSAGRVEIPKKSNPAKKRALGRWFYSFYIENIGILVYNIDNVALNTVQNSDMFGANEVFMRYLSEINVCESIRETASEVEGKAVYNNGLLGYTFDDR